MRAAILLLLCCTSAAAITPDAIEVPIATRHLQQHAQLSDNTPGIVFQWRTPLTMAGGNVRAHGALFRNSDGDTTVYAGLHPEWRIAGPLFAGGGLGLTYGYKRYSYGGNAWADGVPFTVGNVSGRRYEKRRFNAALQLDARLQVTRNLSLTAHLVADQHLCKSQPAGLHATSCAVWVGLRGEW